MPGEGLERRVAQRPGSREARLLGLLSWARGAGAGAALFRGTEPMASGAGSQSHKERRYDRQLRLWGEHGQAAMEECSVCLINGSAVGAEVIVSGRAGWR